MHSADMMLIQASFQAVEPNAETLADLFYSRLFALDPALRELFTNDAVEQKRKLLAMLAAIVSGLEQLDSLLPVIQDLGRRHIQYGVKDSHYPMVETALLWALEVTLGEAFTFPVERAWRNLYRLVSQTMIGTSSTSS